MHCDKCKSENTRKYSVVFDEGTIIGKSESLSGNEITHFSQNPLAAKCSPPSEPKIGGFLSFIGVVISLYVALRVGLFFHGFLYGVFGLVGGLVGFNVLWWLTIGRTKRRTYEEELAVWRRSWICLKCGHGFEGEG